MSAVAVDGCPSLVRSLAVILTYLNCLNHLKSCFSNHIISISWAVNVSKLSRGLAKFSSQHTVDQINYCLCCKIQWITHFRIAIGKSVLKSLAIQFSVRDFQKYCSSMQQFQIYQQCWLSCYSVSTLTYRSHLECFVLVQCNINLQVNKQSTTLLRHTILIKYKCIQFIRPTADVWKLAESNRNCGWQHTVVTQNYSLLGSFLWFGIIIYMRNKQY